MEYLPYQMIEIIYTMFMLFFKIIILPILTIIGVILFRATKYLRYKNIELEDSIEN